MFIKHNKTICYLSFITAPNRLWYHINIDIQIYGNDYIKEKLGVIDPEQAEELRKQFEQAIESFDKRKTDYLEKHILKFNKEQYPFYLLRINKTATMIFIEKGLHTLDPDNPHYPRGNPWAVVYNTDGPETIMNKLYDDRKDFGAEIHKKLKELMNW
ncbi:MAG: hypothetical protein GY861_25360 [bacterium]|nr:hypothetical protein [bacterium]